MDPPKTIPTIVAAVDYSEVSRHALRKAFDNAQQQVSELHVVHVLEPHLTQSDESATNTLRNFVDLELQAWRKAGHREPPRVVPHVIRGRQADEIAQIADDLNATVLIVGKHGRHGVRKLLSGSVTDRIVRLSPVPVLVVPQPEPDTVATPAIEPACPQCIATRRATQGKVLWCEQHRQPREHFHTFHQMDRNVEGRTANSLLIRV